MKVFVFCEYSNTVSGAFRERGHDVTSCDLEPSEGPPEFHVQGDGRELLRIRWDIVIAHPPCTHLANSGVGRLFDLERYPDRRERLDAAAEFFRLCLDANAPMVAVENPVMHKYAVERVGRKHDFTIQPYQFGHPVSKRTAFWTKGLPPLMPTEIVENRGPGWMMAMTPSEHRAKDRSRTFPGVASAMADQWGSL